MRLLSITWLFLIISCSHEPARSLASKSRPTNLNVDPQNSSFYLVDGKKFLLQPKNNLNEAIEISSTEVKVKNGQGKLIPFQLQRVGSGKYYVFPTENVKEIEVRVQDKLIGKKLKSSDRKPYASHSKFTIISLEENQLYLQLKLADKDEKSISSDEIPEIILDGEGSIDELKSQGNGVWTISLGLPEYNQILYLSVRSQGVYLEKIFRYQHVEK